MTSMKPTPFIHLIADYGTGDLAFSEVIQRLHRELPQAHILPTSVPAFSTIATGFVLAQLALNDPTPGMAIYSNTAPRKDDDQKRDKNAGEHLMFAQLDNGVQLTAVNAQFAFSFLKPHLKDFRPVKVANQGSQFRSRDFYPQAFAKIIQGETSLLGETMSLDSIPDIPKNRLMFVDGYGNIKTTIRQSDVPYAPGEKIRIKIADNTRTALYSDGIFAVKAGDLVFAPGSSGGKDRFMEISLRGSNAHQLFFEPHVESPIHFETLD